MLTITVIVSRAGVTQRRVCSFDGVKMPASWPLLWQKARVRSLPLPQLPGMPCLRNVPLPKWRMLCRLGRQTLLASSAMLAADVGKEEVGNIWRVVTVLTGTLFTRVCCGRTRLSRDRVVVRGKCRLWVRFFGFLRRVGVSKFRILYIAFCVVFLAISWLKSYYSNGLLYVFPTRNIINFPINFTYLTATYFSKARYSLFVLKVPLNPIQSILATLYNSCCSRLIWGLLWNGFES